MRVGSIRVTHPCAGRHQRVLLLAMLPLDLHVLSLPLAFILSQDQTLHCIINNLNFFFVCPALPDFTILSSLTVPTVRRLAAAKPSLPCAKYSSSLLLRLQYLLNFPFRSNLKFLNLDRRFRKHAPVSRGALFPERDRKGTPTFLSNKLFRHFFVEKILILWLSI